ncbi:MAG: hypothetical protein SFW07_02350 [Gammaproteobacteria bacterium]|nr:hypothetical protein [Gammaproteobacteria bacterium]
MEDTSKEAALLGKSMSSSVLNSASPTSELTKLAEGPYVFAVMLSELSYPFHLIFYGGGKGAIEALYKQASKYPSIHPVNDNDSMDSRLTVSVGKHKDPDLTYKQCKEFVYDIAGMADFKRSAQKAVEILENLPAPHLENASSTMIKLGK